MYINYEDITNEVLIDCRTSEEFAIMPLFKKNIPIINRKTHLIIKKFYPCAFFVIIYGLIKNYKDIKQKLLLYSDNCTKDIILGCSRGRLRSPIMYLYARSIGINAKVLKNGIKRFYK
ncbi:MAG: hypothetical protein R3Y64_00405 [Peptostreptococcaceae bacterium]